MENTPIYHSELEWRASKFLSPRCKLFALHSCRVHELSLIVQEGKSIFET